MEFKLKVNKRYKLNDGNEYVLIGTYGNLATCKNKFVVLVDDIRWKRKTLTIQDFYEQVK
jgi:hypothetical protein